MPAPVSAGVRTATARMPRPLGKFGIEKDVERGDLAVADVVQSGSAPDIRGFRGPSRW
jgi:hypothetical protein